MTLHWPQALWLLLVPILFAALELRRRRKVQESTHPKILRAEAGPRELVLPSGDALRPPGTGARFRWRLILGLVAVVLALSRPQWGELDEPVFDQSREIILALDLSRSMLAPDVKPSRLERAKLLVTSLLERLAGERVGLIVFSGTAFLQSPLSSDYEILNEFLPALTPDYLPEGGTNYQALIDTALDAFGSSGSADRFLIVLSDGEATDQTWRAGAQELKKRGIRVLGLGLGTTQGSILPDGKGGYVKDDRGAVVLSKLEPATLQALASESGGVYTDASSWVDLAQLLQSTVEAGQKGAFKEERHVRRVERFQWVLGPALVLLLWSLWQEFPVYPRARDVKVGRRVEPSRAPGSTSATTAALVILLGFSATPPLARCAETAVAEPLSKLVADFSARPALNARDYAELAQTTLTYGQRIKSSQPTIPEGPIEDGLAAVAAGKTLDRKAADWDTLERDLRKLLEKPETPPESPPPPSDSDNSQKEENQPKDPKPSGDKSQSPEQKKSDDGKEPESKQSPTPPPSQDSPSPGGEEKQPPSSDSAFGPMQSEPKTPPKSEPKNQATPEIQKVGGSQENREVPPTDPALVVPLQRLQQVRNLDAPVRLQQLLRGDRETPQKSGKTW